MPWDAEHFVGMVLSSGIGAGAMKLLEHLRTRRKDEHGFTQDDREFSMEVWDRTQVQIQGLLADSKRCHEDYAVSQRENAVMKGEIAANAVRLQVMQETLARLEGANVTALIDADVSGTIRAWSAGARIMFGYDEKEAVGMAIDRLVPPYLRQRHHRAFQAAVKQEGEYATRNVRDTMGLDRLGNLFPIHIQVIRYPMFDVTGKEQIMFNAQITRKL